MGGNPLSYVDPLGLMKLPSNPGGLPPEWTYDPTHLDPNGLRYRDPSGNVLDFHNGRPGKPGWRGKNHWHYNGCDDHLEEGDEVPDAVPAPDPEPGQEPDMNRVPAPSPATWGALIVTGLGAAAAYLLSPVGG